MVQARQRRPSHRERNEVAAEAGGGGAGGGSQEPLRRAAAAAGGGAAEGESAAAADAGMEGPIASAESERMTAVADYEASMGGLGAVEARSQRLGPEITFEPAAGGRQDAATREAAIDQVRAFMARAAARSPAPSPSRASRCPDAWAGWPRP